MAAADHHDVPPPGGQLDHRFRQPDPTQHVLNAHRPTLPRARPLADRHERDTNAVARAATHHSRRSPRRRSIDEVRVEHQQGVYDVRCEWGRHGVEMLARAVRRRRHRGRVVVLHVGRRRRGPRRPGAPPAVAQPLRRTGGGHARGAAGGAAGRRRAVAAAVVAARPGRGHRAGAAVAQRRFALRRGRLHDVSSSRAACATRRPSPPRPCPRAARSGWCPPVSAGPTTRCASRPRTPSARARSSPRSAGVALPGGGARRGAVRRRRGPPARSTGRARLGPGADRRRLPRRRRPGRGPRRQPGRAAARRRRPDLSTAPARSCRGRSHGRNIGRLASDP